MSRKTKRLQRKAERWREAREAMEKADIDRAARVIGTACKKVVARMRLTQLKRRQGRAARVITTALQRYVTLRKVANEKEEIARVQAPLCLPPTRKAALAIPEELALGGVGVLRKDNLRPFVLAIAQKHPSLSDWAPDDVSMYAETVLAIAFHKTSHCGEIHLGDLRSSGFLESLNAMREAEYDTESSVFFSVAQHERMHAAYRSLCGNGWYVDTSNLAGYRHDGGSSVGPVRASRVIIDAGLRQFRSSSEGIASVESGGYGHSIDYGAFVRFFLCEEALRTGTCSKQDIEYCFSLVDQAGTGRIGVVEAEPFYQSMMNEWGAFGGEVKSFPPVELVVLQHLDAMGVQNEVDHITLEEMTTPGNVAVAGRFFEELFSGATPEYDLRVEGNGNDVTGDGNQVGDGEGVDNGFGATANGHDVGGNESNLVYNIGFGCHDGYADGWGYGYGTHPGFGDSGVHDNGFGCGWGNRNVYMSGCAYVQGMGNGWGTHPGFGLADGGVYDNGFGSNWVSSNVHTSGCAYDQGIGWGYGYGTHPGFADGGVYDNGFGCGYGVDHNYGNAWGWGYVNDVNNGWVYGQGMGNGWSNAHYVYNGYGWN